MTHTCQVFDVQRFSIHDGPGIRTTVFLEGCPLRCLWCQNPEAFGHGHARPMTPEAIVAEALKDRAYYQASGGGLTISGGEPLLHRESLVALLEEAKAHGLHTCLQTSGAVPTASLVAALGWVDLFQLDLKHMDTTRHRALTGAGNERIHHNIAFLLAEGAAVEIRLPLVPGVNHDPTNLEAVARFLTEHGVRALRLVPYQRLYLDKYTALGLVPPLPRIEPPTSAALEEVTERFQRHQIAVAVDG